MKYARAVLKMKKQKRPERKRKQAKKKKEKNQNPRLMVAHFRNNHRPRLSQKDRLRCVMKPHLTAS